MVTGDSNSLSLGTSIQRIERAPAESGLQGISISSTTIFGSAAVGPRTCLKWVALCSSRIGSINASRIKTLISRQEYLQRFFKKFILRGIQQMSTVKNYEPFSGLGNRCKILFSQGVFSVPKSNFAQTHPIRLVGQMSTDSFFKTSSGHSKVTIV